MINVKITRTPDKDLVQLSGYSIYQTPGKKKRLQINDHLYRVDDTTYNQFKSGLDAMTVQDLQTGNISIIYAGTDPNQPADIGTDAGLVLSSGTPQQFKDAEAYYKSMKTTYGLSLSRSFHN